MSKIGVIRVVVVALWLFLMVQLVRDRATDAGGAGIVPTTTVAEEAAAETQEAWMGVYLGGHKVGYTHYRFVPSSGGYRFGQTALLRMKIMDSEQVVHVSIEGETGADYALKVFKADLRSGVGDLSAHGRVEGKELVLTIHTGVESTEQHLAVREPIYLPVGARRHLRQQDLHPGHQVAVQVFDPATMRYQPIRYTVERRERIEDHGAHKWAWRVREELGSMATTVWLGEQGTVLREEGPLGLVASAETREQALSEGWQPGTAVDLMAVVAVRVAAKIPDARSLGRLEVRVSGVDGEAIPIDARQRLEGDRLIVERERVSEANTFVLPYRGTEWSGELAATPFLQVRHPRVRSAADEATAGRTDAREVAQSIRRWVFSRLRKVPTVSIPNALQVLEMGAGDCNEHAVLFAALARAVGLPARIVAGLVYSDEVFLYHAWNEVWLGNGWVSVDPTFDQMPVDATHIKLVEGGPEVHDRLLRVIGRLGIDVLATG